MDEAATTKADGGRSGCDRSAAQGRLGRAGDRAGAWPLAQRDQRGDRARMRHGRPLRRRAGTSRGGSAGGLSGRKARLAPDGPLFAEVTRLLRLQWSPEQIAGRRKRLEDGTEMSSGLRVSHEAIYQAIYAVPRGELRRELLACLRQGKPQRGRRSKDGERRGRICDSIRERPAEVEGAWALGGRSDQGGRQPRGDA